MIIAPDKRGEVSAKDIHPKLTQSLLEVVDPIIDDYFGTTCGCIITSLNDSQHSYSSLHYAGCAADIRTWMNPQGDQISWADKLALVKRIGDALLAQYGNIFDAVAERDHIHQELQPKRPPT